MRRKTKAPIDDRPVPWEEGPISRERWQKHRDWMMAASGAGRRPRNGGCTNKDASSRKTRRRFCTQWASFVAGSLPDAWSGGVTPTRTPTRSSRSAASGRSEKRQQSGRRISTSTMSRMSLSNSGMPRRRKVRHEQTRGRPARCGDVLSAAAAVLA